MQCLLQYENLKGDKQGMTEEMKRLNGYKQVMNFFEGSGFAVEGDTIYLAVSNKDTETINALKPLCKGAVKEENGDTLFELGKTELKFTDTSLYLLYNVNGEEWEYTEADFKESVQDIYEFLRDNSAYMIYVKDDKIFVGRKDK